MRKDSAPDVGCPSSRAWLAFRKIAGFGSQLTLRLILSSVVIKASDLANNSSNLSRKSPMNKPEDNASHELEETCSHSGPGGAIPIVQFEKLAQGAKEVVVEFEEQQYRLRVTKNGKLILNK